MPNSNRASAFGRRSGTVTVIEERVRRSAARNAKITGCVAWVIVTLLSAAVLASRWHPVLALLAGALIGLAAAFVVAVAVLIWPVVRVIWWWLPEITLAFGMITSWTWLADRLAAGYLLGAVMLTAGVPALIPQLRRPIAALAWCLVVRHRLRTCFAEFIITNRTGTLPHILHAIPTPVGERVWLWLRPGLALADLQSRADLIAVACWADTVIAEAASAANSAYVRIDIKRRDALTGTVISPLLRHVLPGAPAKELDTTGVPQALDLPDITAEQVTPAAAGKPARADKTPAAQPPVVATAAGEDITDWL